MISMAWCKQLFVAQQIIDLAPDWKPTVRYPETDIDFKISPYDIQWHTDHGTS